MVLWEWELNKNIAFESKLIEKWILLVHVFINAVDLPIRMHSLHTYTVYTTKLSNGL